MPTHPDQNGYPLPVPVDDGSRLCVVVRIPNIAGHRQAFLGAVAELTHAYSWGNDDDHTALLVAALWKNIWDEMLSTFYDDECGDDMKRCCVEDITVVIEHRLNPVTGRPEVSDDGGTTWYPDPNDPMQIIVSRPPPVTSGVFTSKCGAATNGKQHIVDLIAGTVANFTEGISVFELAVAIAGLALEIALVIFTGGAAAWALTPQILALVGLIWSGAVALFTMGVSAFEAYWDDFEKDKILCALFCTIGENGAFTDAQFEAFMSRWKELSTPSPAFNIMTNFVRAGGVKLLNQYCAYGAAEDEACEDCGCGCDLTGWEIQFGTLIDRDENHITVQCVVISGSHVATIHSQTPTSCCKFSQPVVTGVGSPVYTWGVVPESFPSTFDGYPHSTVWGAGRDVNGISVFGFSGQVIDTVTFTITGECD